MASDAIVLNGTRECLISNHSLFPLLLSRRPRRPFVCISHTPEVSSRNRVLKMLVSAFVPVPPSQPWPGPAAPCSIPRLTESLRLPLLCPKAASVDSCKGLRELNCSPFKRVITPLAAAPLLREYPLSASSSVSLLAGFEGCRDGEWKDTKDKTSVLSLQVR